MAALESVRAALVSFFFEYDTVKMVHVKSRTVGVVSRWLQLTILCYVFGWVILWNKGYQSFDIGVSGVTSKVKGVQFSNLTAAYPEVGLRVWDVADFVIPPQQSNAFFVMTNVVITPNQSQGRCEEDASVSAARCVTDSDCAAGEPLLLGNGVLTGRCLYSTRRPGKRVCEVYAWCPVESEEPVLKQPVLAGTRHFTVLIRNQVFFPYFQKHQSNVLHSFSHDYVRSCAYHPIMDPFCPVFRLGEIVESIPGENYTQLAMKGGVVTIRINWDCNYDYAEENCRPTYSFERLDAERSAAAFRGYNFRFANHYVEGGVQRRTLYKAYGILFSISVTARARAFNIVPLLLNLSSGLALMSLATIVSDIVLLFLHRRRAQFKRTVFELMRRRGSGVSSASSRTYRAVSVKCAADALSPQSPPSNVAAGTVL